MRHVRPLPVPTVWLKLMIIYRASYMHEQVFQSVLLSRRRSLQTAEWLYHPCQPFPRRGALQMFVSPLRQAARKQHLLGSGNPSIHPGGSS